MFLNITVVLPSCYIQAHRQGQVRLNKMTSLIKSLTHQVAELSNQERSEHGSKMSNKVTSKGETDKTIEKIWQVGGKFAIMYCLWVNNIEAAFQTALNNNYTLMDQFQPGAEWKHQGEKNDLFEVFPKEYHSEFNHDFIPPIVCVNNFYYLVV